MSVNEEDKELKLDFNKDVFDKEIQDLTNKLVPIVIEQFEGERNIVCVYTILTILNVLLKETDDAGLSEIIKLGVYSPDVESRNKSSGVSSSEKED